MASKIEELIQELCPDGVEYVDLGSITTAVNIGINPRKFFKLNPENAEGFYVTVRELNGLQGVKNTAKTDQISLEAVKIIQSRAGIQEGDILFSNTGTVGKMALVLEDPKNWGVNEGIYVIKPKQELIISKFLYYYLSSTKAILDYSAKFTGSTLKHVTQKALTSLKIPVPPLEIQKEIVKVLDNFTDYSTELQTELQARVKQYEYYRDKILSFDNLTSEGRQVEWQALGELLDYEQPGKYIVESTKYSDAYATPVLTAGQSFILGYTNETSGVYNATKESPVMIFDDFTTSFHWVDFKFKVKSSAMKILTPKNIGVNFKYVFYAMKCIKYNPGSHARQWIDKFSKIQIPIPSQDSQERIVGIINTFNKVCNSLESGLPAEIAARQKQYEYYRDKLLTFKEFQR